MSRIMALAAGLSLGLASLPAAATTMQTVYTGTIDVVDYADLFGTGSTDLTGVSYTATYVYETTGSGQINDPNNNTVYGGDVYGTPSPVISATLTINGQSVSFDTTNYSSSSVSSDSTTTLYENYAQGPDGSAIDSFVQTSELNSVEMLSLGVV